MEEQKNDLLCEGLPTFPRPEIGTVLVTGATGYIGGRLVRELLARGYRVRVMVRKHSAALDKRWPEATIVVGNALNYQSLVAAMEGVHTAYYLIHSLLLGPRSFESVDSCAAENFKNAAAACGLKRLIYLGGLGDIRAKLSNHLKSRIKVADTLGEGPVPVTILRAAVIIGSGSASYEIMKHLAKNVSLFFVPTWAKTRSQPIGIRDVIKYLVGVLESDETIGKSYDIGGTDIYSYEQMLKMLAMLLGKKTVFLPSPVSSIRCYSYVASLLTPVPMQIITCLMEGCKNEVVCQDNDIRSVLPFPLLSYKESIVRAMTREEMDNVHSRWSDSFFPEHTDFVRLEELPHTPRHTSSYTLLTPKSRTSIFYAFCRVGGDEGWFHTNWMWRTRGMIDSLLMGVGTSRGRRTTSNLRVNDVIDFWRVEELKPGHMLLLRAEMKIPGRAWLEFSVERAYNSNRLTVTAYFDPSGLSGHLYWYFFLPFHHFIFTDMLKQIEARSRKEERKSPENSSDTAPS